MIRHLFIAALRNMAANRLVSAISILGLAVGIAVAILMGLVVRNQMSFDHFIPGHAQTYRAIFALSPPDSCGERRGCPLDYRMAALLKFNVPEIESVARLVYTDTSPVKLRRGNVTAWEMLYWADPEIFSVLPLPVLHGDLRNALHRPDGIVLPRAMAEKYFGHADAVGGIITLDGHPMVVRAVIADLPANATELKSGIFASGQASFSKIVPANGGGADARSRNAYLSAIVYMRLKPGASVAEVEMQASKWHWSTVPSSDRATYIKAGVSLDVRLLRLDRINLSEVFNPGIGQRLAAAALAGFLVLFIAAINAINLMVVCAARREREVGMRKACGAGRAALIAQFLGEAMAAVALASCIALAASEWLLPAINGFLQTGARLNYASDPAVLPFLLLCILFLGLAAGAYPALVLSAFKPATVLRGWAASMVDTGVIRNALVTLQFAVLIILAVSAGVIWQQRNYATREALRVDTDQMLLVRTVAGPGLVEDMTSPLACPAGFRDEVRRLPGVSGVVCSGSSFLIGNVVTSWSRRDGAEDMMTATQVDPGLLSLYGIKPVAGALPANVGALGMGVVLNVSAVRKLGFESPQAAIGQSWLPSSVMTAAEFGSMSKRWGPHAIVTAVIPDFAFTSVRQAVGPALFSPWEYGSRSRLIHVKLNGHQIPQTLAAIDRLWETTNQPGPLDRFFLDDYMQQLYQDMTREAQFFSLFAAIAIILACLGLIGIAISTTERRTKEIGVRKAMGATSARIVTLLLWQFVQPVLWANVIAWPVAWWLMRQWLVSYSRHVELEPGLFLAASAVALFVALITVAGQAWITARAKPVLALRYE
jgi:putative ABC transport system permease protein